jgi:hypothetical protein
VIPYVLVNPLSQLPQYKNLRNLTSPATSRSPSTVKADITAMLQARIEQLEEQFKVLQQRLDQGSTSSGRTTSRSIGTDPPPTPLIISDSPGLTGVGGILLTSSAVMTTMPSTSPAFGFRRLEHSPSGPSNYAFPAVPRDSSADVEFDGLMKVMVNRPDSDYTTSPMAHQPSLNAVPPIDVPLVNSPVTMNPHPQGKSTRGGSSRIEANHGPLCTSISL